MSQRFAQRNLCLRTGASGEWNQKCEARLHSLLQRKPPLALEDGHADEEGRPPNQAAIRDAANRPKIHHPIRRPIHHHRARTLSPGCPQSPDEVDLQNNELFRGASHRRRWRKRVRRLRFCRQTSRTSSRPCMRSPRTWKRQSELEEKTDNSIPRG